MARMTEVAVTYGNSHFFDVRVCTESVFSCYNKLLIIKPKTMPELRSHHAKEAGVIKRGDYHVYDQ